MQPDPGLQGRVPPPQGQRLASVLLSGRSFGGGDWESQAARPWGAPGYGGSINPIAWAVVWAPVASTRCSRGWRSGPVGGGSWPFVLAMGARGYSAKD